MRQRALLPAGGSQLPVYRPFPLWAYGLEKARVSVTVARVHILNQQSTGKGAIGCLRVLLSVLISELSWVSGIYRPKPEV